ncbi:MAG: ribonuclease [Tissierellia bacterium]|nr:ribonuclease [Tissierellia bacterium]
MFKKLLSILLILILIFSLFGCIPAPTVEQPNLDVNEANETETIAEDGVYTTPEEVAEYIHTYEKLPSNYLTKRQAMDLGWDSSKGNLWDVTDEGIIGGDKFGNREGLLPKENGRTYYECDVNYEGGYRGAERLVYSNDGLIFYTKDHYKSFKQLY